MRTGLLGGANQLSANAPPGTSTRSMVTVRGSARRPDSPPPPMDGPASVAGPRSGRGRPPAPAPPRCAERASGRPEPVSAVGFDDTASSIMAGAPSPRRIGGTPPGPGRPPRPASSGPRPSGPRASGPRPSGPRPSGPRPSGPRASGPRPRSGPPNVNSARCTRCEPGSSVSTMFSGPRNPRSMMLAQMRSSPEVLQRAIS